MCFSQDWQVAKCLSTKAKARQVASKWQALLTTWLKHLWARIESFYLGCVIQHLSMHYYIALDKVEQLKINILRLVFSFYIRGVVITHSESLGKGTYLATHTKLSLSIPIIPLCLKLSRCSHICWFVLKNFQHY